MKERIVSVVFLLLFFVPITQSITENTCLIPTVVQIDTLLRDEKIYFTYPSSDQLNLVLWYADNTGSHETELIFPSSTILRLNPTGSYIVAIEYEGEVYLYGDEVYEGWGSIINSINILDTSTMSITNLILPEEWRNTPFIKRVMWIDNERILILSKTEYHIAGVINISTGEFETLDWLNRLSYPYIPSSGGGLISVSPSGNYLYYTLADPFVPSIHWSTSPGFSVLPWTIINWAGEEVLGYRGGVGFYTRWFDEESIITLDTESNDLLRITLDGAVQRLTENTSNLYYRYLASPTGSKVAFTTEIDEKDGFHQEQPAVLNVETGAITHFCVEAIRIGKETWSSDGRLLIYVANSISDSLGGTDIFALDTIDNHQISILPERIENAAIGMRFIRVVGISN